MAQLNLLKTAYFLMRNRRLYQLAALAKAERQFSLETQLLATAITATEMQFRPLLHRLAEYTYVLLLLLLGRDAGAVSVGISQISIRHYVSFERTTQFQSLLLSMSAKKSLSTCCKIVGAESNKSLEHICRVYNGNSTRYYWRALRKNHTLLCTLEAHRGNRKLRH